MFVHGCGAKDAMAFVASKRESAVTAGLKKFCAVPFSTAAVRPHHARSSERTLACMSTPCSSRRRGGAGRATNALFRCAYRRNPLLRLPPEAVSFQAGNQCFVAFVAQPLGVLLGHPFGFVPVDLLRREVGQRQSAILSEVNRRVPKINRRNFRSLRRAARLGGGVRGHRFCGCAWNFDRDGSGAQDRGRRGRHFACGLHRGEARADFLPSLGRRCHLPAVVVSTASTSARFLAILRTVL